MSVFGHAFRITTYGESHGTSVGCIVEGCPPRLPLNEGDIQTQLNRRRPGQSALTTPRDEKDRVNIESGTEFGLTLGTPIALRVLNENQRPKDYGGGGRNIDNFPRPSHADWTYLEKYGIKASSGGGRSSARETVARVAGGAIAEKFLSTLGVEIVAFTSSVGKEHLFPPTNEFPYKSMNPAFLKLINNITRADVDSFLPVRCPDADASRRMEDTIAHYRDQKDSIGGSVTCVIRQCPSGLGEPCFDKLEAALAHAMMSIPATKGFEIGAGTDSGLIPGSQLNDPFIEAAVPTNSAARPSTTSTPRLTTKTNHSGGVQGGISNAAPIFFTVWFKAPATISQPQVTARYDGSEGILEAKGRHDPCVIPRAVPIVEAMAALTIMDAYLMQSGRQHAAASLADTQNVVKAPAPAEDGLSNVQS